MAADLRGILNETRAWREFRDAPAAVRRDDSIDEELLDACERLVGALDAMPEHIPPDAPERGALESQLQAARPHLRDAQFRATCAGFTWMHDRARELRDKTGHSTLQKCFPQYGEFFAALDDGDRMMGNSQHSPESREKFLAWAERTRQKLADLHRQMRVCESAAFDAKRRERRFFWLTALSVLAALGALIAALAA